MVQEGGVMQEINSEDLSKPQQQYLPVLDELGLETMMMPGRVLYSHREFYLKRTYDQMPDTAYPVYSLRLYLLRDGKMKINTLRRHGTRQIWEEVSFSSVMTRFLRQKTCAHLHTFVETGLEAELQPGNPLPHQPEQP